MHLERTDFCFKTLLYFQDTMRLNGMSESSALGQPHHSMRSQSLRHVNGQVLSTSSIAFSSCSSVKRCFSLRAAAVVSPFCVRRVAVRSMCTCSDEYDLIENTCTHRSTHHWNVKLIQFLPSAILWCEYVHFVVVKMPSVPDAAHYAFHVHAEGAVIVGEQRQAEAVLKKTSCRSHLRRMSVPLPNVRVLLVVRI